MLYCNEAWFSSELPPGWGRIWLVVGRQVYIDHVNECTDRESVPVPQSTGLGLRPLYYDDLMHRK